MWIFSTLVSVTRVESFRQKLVSTSKTGWTRDPVPCDVMVVVVASRCLWRHWKWRMTLTLSVDIASARVIEWYATFDDDVVCCHGYSSACTSHVTVCDDVICCCYYQWSPWWWYVPKYHCATFIFAYLWFLLTGFNNSFVLEVRNDQHTHLE